MIVSYCYYITNSSKYVLFFVHFRKYNETYVKILTIITQKACPKISLSNQSWLSKNILCGMALY